MKMEQKLLAEMASVETMFRGSISKRRQGKSGGEYFAVQCWRNGRNECRYVPPARKGRSPRSRWSTGERSGSPRRARSSRRPKLH